MIAKTKKSSDIAEDVDAVKRAASGRWPEILAAICRLPIEILDGKHHPCPKCGGKDRFNLAYPPDGSVRCNHCFSTKNGDGLAAIQWMNAWTFHQAMNAVAEFLGYTLRGSYSGGKADPAKDLKFQTWNVEVAELFTVSKPGITTDAMVLCGARRAMYQGSVVIALPVYDNSLANQCGWVVYPISGSLRKHGKGNTTELVKVKNTYGSKPGIMGPVERLDADTLWFVEGPTDLMALLAVKPDLAAFCNAMGCGERPAAFLPYVEGKDVVIVRDADKPGKDGAERWAVAMAKVAKSVKVVKLPYDVQESHGKDLRDFFNDGHQFEELEGIAAAAEPEPADAKIAAIRSIDDPYRLAHLNLIKYKHCHGGELRYWRQQWYKFNGKRYRKIDTDELESRVRTNIQEEFDRAFSDGCEDRETVRHVLTSLVKNTMESMRGMCQLKGDVENGSWVNDDGEPEKRQYISMENGIVDLARILETESTDDCLLEHDPRWFCTIHLPYPFREFKDLEEVEAGCPKWMAFLRRNLEGDQERIDLLQEWAGYCLLPDTGFQKFLVHEGEGANGKSVFCAAMIAILGRENCSSVPLERFGDRFALAETLGKLLNVCPDISEIDSIAEGQIKSFTSGDSMNFDRKNIKSIEAVPTARLMMMCNNLPGISDKSDGLWRRLMLVPWRIQIPPKDRVPNMDKSWWWEQSGELPAMLMWAIHGFNHLNKQRRFSEPKLCREAHGDYKLSQNAVAMFIRENYTLVENDDVFQPSNEMYQHFRRWCVDQGYDVVSATGFGRQVGMTLRVKSAVRRINGPLVRGYPGVSIKNDDDGGF